MLLSETLNNNIINDEQEFGKYVDMISDDTPLSLDIILSWLNDEVEELEHVKCVNGCIIIPPQYDEDEDENELQDCTIRLVKNSQNTFRLEYAYFYVKAYTITPEMYSTQNNNWHVISNSLKTVGDLNDAWLNMTEQIDNDYDYDIDDTF